MSASASRKKRRGKLVATNRQGYLPANIIKPAWGLIGGMPPAFADGMDNEGVTGLKIQRVWGDTTSILDNTSQSLDITCPAGTYVISGGFDKGTSLLYDVYESYAVNGTTWRISVRNEFGGAVTASAFAMCLSIGAGTGIDVAQRGLRPARSGPRK